jgi:hypothetical protein
MRRTGERWFSLGVTDQTVCFGSTAAGAVVVRVPAVTDDQPYEPDLFLTKARPSLQSSLCALTCRCQSGVYLLALTQPTALCVLHARRLKIERPHAFVPTAGSTCPAYARMAFQPSDNNNALIVDVVRCLSRFPLGALVV